jgi:hypothetical protein
LPVDRATGPADFHQENIVASGAINASYLTSFDRPGVVTNPIFTDQVGRIMQYRYLECTVAKDLWKLNLTNAATVTDAARNERWRAEIKLIATVNISRFELNYHHYYCTIEESITP